MVGALGRGVGIKARDEAIKSVKHNRFDIFYARLVSPYKQELGFGDGEESPEFVD
jgi:hypothetical protein